MTKLSPSDLRIPGATEFDIGVERSLLGGCLLDTRGCREWPQLQAGYFYLERHQQLWDTMLELTEVTDRPDALMVGHELQRKGIVFEEGGNLAYLAGILEAGTACVDLQRYGELVRRAAAERDRVRLASALLANPEGSEQVEAILRSLEEQPGRSEPLTAVFPRLETRRTDTVYETGMELLDIRAGQVLVVGGRTSHGKTAFMVDLAKRLARQDYRVDYVTLEDPAEAIAARMIAGDSGKTLYYVRYSRLSGLDEERNSLEMLPITVTSVPGCREAAVIGAVAASEGEIVFLDHLQQIGLEESSDDSRNRTIERIMGRLSAWARRDHKAIVLGCQLNREMEKTKREPTLADLKDSGSIEQAARAVWLVYWPAKHKVDPTEAQKREFVVKIEKASEGPTLRRHLKWEPRSGRFYDPKTEPVPEAW